MSDVPASRDEAVEQAREAMVKSVVQDLVDQMRPISEAFAVHAEALKAVIDRQDEADTEQRSLRRRNGIMAIAVLVLAVGFLCSQALQWHWNHTLTRIAEVNRDNGRYLKECTTPAPAKPLDKNDERHECYERAQKNQGGVLELLHADQEDIAARAAYCARANSTLNAITTCIRTATP